jgi:hypothetical protein
MMTEISRGTICRFEDGTAGFDFDETGEIMQWSDPDLGVNPSMFPTGARMILTENFITYPDPDEPGEFLAETVSLDLTYE